MSWSRDLAAVLRGLEKVAQAAAVHQQQEFARVWANSSIRSAVKGVGNKAEEVLSDTVLKQDKVIVSTCFNLI